MSIIVAIGIGLVVGLVARALMPGNDPGGWIVTALLGIGGAMLANVIGRSIGWYSEGDAGGFISAVIGAMLLLFFYRLLKGGSRPRTP